MRRTLRAGCLLSLAALALVANASGRALDVTIVTVEVIGQGRVTSDPEGIECGDGETRCTGAFTGDVRLTASDTADDWAFDRWGDVGDTDSCGTPTENHCRITGSGEHQVTANFTGPGGRARTLSVAYTGQGNVHDGITGAPGNINCGSSPAGTDCEWTVPNGSMLTVHEDPAAGSVFTGWGGACGGTNESCTVEMDEDRTVNARWETASSTFLLTVAVVGKGEVEGAGIDCPSTCTATEAANSTATLTASADEGYVFTGWSGAPCAGTVPVCAVPMDIDRDVTATFALAATLSVSVTGNGSVTGGSGAINCGSGGTSCSAAFTPNATVTLTAVPATGATFLGWSGACGGTSLTCTVLMNQAKSVNAVFSATGGGTGLALTVSVSGAGTVTGGGINCGNGASTCTANQTPNAVVTLTATPASGATFAGWGGACSGTGTTCTVTMTAARSVTATFTGGSSTVLLTVSVTGSGTVTGGGINCGNGATTCTAQEPPNSSVTLTATPASGATFIGWGGSCSGTGTSCTVSMTAARSVTAQFTTRSGAGAGTLTIGVTGRGTVRTSAGTCIATGKPKTCVQHFKAGATVVLTAAPAAGGKFLGWGGACAGTKTVTCSVRLDTAKAVTAGFSGAAVTRRATLTSLGRPTVREVENGFLVTLHFRTTRAGMASVRGLRAGRVVTRVSIRVAAGVVRIGPFPVAKDGFYTFEARLAGAVIRWRACLGRCGNAAPGSFVLVREPPVATRTGNVWSVLFHVRANQISQAEARAYRGKQLLVDKKFLAPAGRITIGPFLLGPGSYTVRLTAHDPYGRTRTLTWIVALAR